MNGGNGFPDRASAPTGVFAYGCPSSPIVTPDVAPVPVTPTPGLGTITPFDWTKWHPEAGALALCSKCNNHHRSADPCPFCLRAELDALKLALGDKAKPAEEIENLRAFVRKILGAMRETAERPKKDSKRTQRRVYEEYMKRAAEAQKAAKEKT